MHGEPLLRKELKPGDTFRYAKSTIKLWVPVVGQQAPTGYSPSNVPADSLKDLEAEVVLIPQFSKPDEPAHYTALKPEPIDVIESWGLGFRLANVLKYVARAGRKAGVSGVSDLEKARRYLTREINALNGKASWDAAE